MNEGLNGFIRFAGGMILKGFLRTLLCGIVLTGELHAQEVIVAREKKSEPPQQTPRPPEQAVSESPTPRKSKPHKVNSAPARLTLEEMRAAGARAAEGPNDGSVPHSTKTRPPEVENAPAPSRIVPETPRPRKRETSVEQSSPSHRSKSGSTNMEGMGPIRPTMIESGREPPSPSPSGR
ncbi:MAG TPA: hypothetical protein VFQ78_16105 [Candidatus Udaeobacter sp.]|nr:hypothetical protein [Candidatus Udaeobacter sp.]